MAGNGKEARTTAVVSTVAGAVAGGPVGAAVGYLSNAARIAAQSFPGSGNRFDYANRGGTTADGNRSFGANLRGLGFSVEWSQRVGGFVEKYLPRSGEPYNPKNGDPTGKYPYGDQPEGSDQIAEGARCGPQ